jgi:1-acyl-sn-glycerol-3-phosphate acyltransferase
VSRSNDAAGFGVPAPWLIRVGAGAILRFLHGIGQIVCRVPIETEGFELVDVTTPSIVVANHHSLVDTPVVFMALSGARRWRTATVGGLDYFAARSEQPWHERLFRRVVIAFIRGSMNVLLIDREGGEYSHIDRIDAMLSAGWSLVIFPEATRSRTGRMGRFRHGAAELARRHGLPVLPVHIDGTQRVLPPGVRWPKPSTIRLRAGEPLHLGADESISDFTRRLRAAVEALGNESAVAALKTVEPSNMVESAG